MQAQFLDLYRASLKTATEFMKTSLEQTERFQQQQLQMVKSALEESSRSGNQASEVKSLDDIVALNSKLAGNQLERVAEFWSNWWRVAGDAQKSMIDQMQSQLGQAKERVREGYSFTARTSEEAARLAASQMAGAASQIREAEQQAKHQRKSA
ncbi:MAG TPA: phasin family protein [Burkholderiales bacterium]